MQLSVIIPCRNEAHTIGQQLAALARQDVGVPWEVIVADNGSTDGTAREAARYTSRLPTLRIIDAHHTPGVSHARNAGAGMATGERLIFCDADDVVGEGWLAAMAHALETHPVVASRFDGTRLNPGRSDRPLGQKDGIEALWYPPFLKHAGGSGLGVWKACHDRVGGFDETLRYLEDADYCVRLQLRGYDLYFAEDAVLHVRYSRNPGSSFRQARLWARANTALYRRYGLRGQGSTMAWWEYGEGLWSIARKLRKLRNDRVRGALVWQLGWHLGLLEGAVLNRVPPVPQHR